MWDIIGDIHGCLHELYALLEKLEYEWEPSKSLYKPPENRVLVSVGDIVSRGKHSAVTYGFVRNMIKAGYMLCTRGNHDDKIMRWAKGNKVKLLHGDDKTTEQLSACNISRESICEFLKNLPYYLSLDEGKLIVVHAAWRDDLIELDPFHKKCRSWCLYGPTTGETTEHGLPVRIDWASKRTAQDFSPIVVYGHQPYSKPRVINKTYGIDTGCAFGGHLTAIQYPEMNCVQVQALETYCKHPTFGKQDG